MIEGKEFPLVPTTLARHSRPLLLDVLDLMTHLRYSAGKMPLRRLLNEVPTNRDNSRGTRAPTTISLMQANLGPAILNSADLGGVAREVLVDDRSHDGDCTLLNRAAAILRQIDDSLCSGIDWRWPWSALLLCLTLLAL